MAYVFISYSRDDYDAAHTLKSELQKNDIESIMDEEISSPGVPWIKSLQETIDKCYAAIVICTKKAMSSHEVCFEWSFAMGAKIPVIPLKYESNCPLHSMLNRLNYLDFCNPRYRPDSILKLCEKIKNLGIREPSVSLPKKSGVEKIFFSREALLKEYSISKILRHAKMNSEIIVVARTGEAWAREYKDLQKLLKDKPVKLKIAIADPHLPKDRWMIMADHGQYDIDVSHNKMIALLGSDIESGCVEIYHLPSSPLQSFVHFTNTDDQKIGIFEIGAGLSMEERIILVLRSNLDHQSLILDRLYKVFSRVFDNARLLRLT